MKNTMKFTVLGLFIFLNQTNLGINWDLKLKNNDNCGMKLKANLLKYEQYFYSHMRRVTVKLIVRGGVPILLLLLLETTLFKTSHY